MEIVFRKVPIAPDIVAGSRCQKRSHSQGELNACSILSLLRSAPGDKEGALTAAEVNGQGFGRAGSAVNRRVRQDGRSILFVLLGQPGPLE